MYQSVICILILSLSFCVCSASDNDRKPNIIFIFADDWGYGDMGIHGSTFCKTPRLDQMAKAGIDFQNFTVNNPVCSPSRAAVMTGHFPARHSVHGHFASSKSHVKRRMPDWLNPQAPMLPRLLQEAGYATAHFGKWHLSNDHIPDGPLPPAYGYDEYGAFNLPGDAPVQMPPAETIPRSIDFMKRHKDQPFFMNLWLHETHTPHYPKEKYLKLFQDLDEQKKVYAAVVAEADHGVGLILDTLKDLKIDQHTLVIFSSDNGPEHTTKIKEMKDASTGPGLGHYYSVGESGGLKGIKRSLFAGGIRVPFIAYWPGVVPAGKTNRDAVLTAVDLLPTFLELAGKDLPKDYKADGVSILAALKGNAFERKKPIFWQWNSSNKKNATWPSSGIRDGKWKLLYHQKFGKSELYDIENDWAESQDRSKDFPEIKEQLIRKIQAWEKTLPQHPPKSCFSKTRKNK